MYKIIIICLIFSSILANRSLAQEKIIYHHAASNHLTFVSFANGEEYHIHENNPLNVDAPVKFNSDNITYFDLSGIGKSDFEKIYSEGLYYSGINYDSLINLTAVVYSIPIESSDSYLAIIHLLLLFDETKGLIGSISDILLKNNYGGIIFTKILPGIDAYEIAVTDDGKYLGIVYGNFWSESQNKIHSCGYEIFNTYTKMRIDKYRLVDSDKLRIVGIASHGNQLKLNLANDISSTNKLVFYSSQNNFKYSTILSRDDYYSLERIDSIGLIFENDTLSFSNSFIKEVLK